jgi:hypothetical protein
MRDCAKGTTPLAQQALDELRRDFLPPSKAHIKRLSRCRPLVLRARPAPEPSRDVNHFNHAYALGQEVKLLNARAASGVPLDCVRIHEDRRPDYTRNATIPPKTTVGTHDDYVAEAERQARLFEQMKEEARRV